MRHAIDPDALGPHGQGIAEAIGKCVHCGFCLPTCPTYVTMGEEMDSPRGRIVLMKEVLEGQLEAELAMPFIDNCLGCLACQTACPSAVEYERLITPFRAYAQQAAPRPLRERLRRRLLLGVLPHPRRMRAATRLGLLIRPLAKQLPATLSPMLALLPSKLPRTQRLPAVHAARGPRRARVALLSGCVQQALAPQITEATLRVLSLNGVETVIPPRQGCCGALAMHEGASTRARAFARRNLRAFPSDVDAVISNAAGCGSAMREYGHLFEGQAEQGRAQAFAGKVLDVCAFLHELGLSEPPPPAREPLEIAYHDACHLAHAQSVRDAPRALLAQIGNLTVLEPAEWEICCGSAGTYNLQKPEVAAQLGARKAKNLLDTGAKLVAAGNIGCIVQIEAHLRPLGEQITLLHTIEVIDRAYARRL